MNRHMQYFKYMVRHKWYVLLAGLKLGVPIWILILHDWDKFLPDEWFPHANYFYGNLPTEQECRTAYMLGISPYTKEQNERDVDKAWLLHQKRNKHHWQFWLLLEDDGGTKLIPMPDVYRREMLADWRGAGRALGFPDTAAWYKSNRDNMQLHPETRSWIESQFELQKREGDIRGIGVLS